MSAPREWHNRRPRGARCGPGCFGCFYERAAARPLEDLEQEIRALEDRRPRVGIAWRDSNYFRALKRARVEITRTL